MDVPDGYTYRADGHLIGIDDQLSGSRRFDLDTAGRVTAVHGGWKRPWRHGDMPVLPDGAGPVSVVERSTRGTGAVRPNCVTGSNLVDTGRVRCAGPSFSGRNSLGAIFRAAAALGMDAVLLSPDCADPLYRRSVKVSMGAVFSVPYARLETWPKGLETVRDAGFNLLALTPDEKARSLDEAAPHRMDRVALMLGAEGDGLSTKALMAADEWVRIPMAHGVDSLNVGAAAAVAFYAVATGRPQP